MIAKRKSAAKSTPSTTAPPPAVPLTPAAEPGPIVVSNAGVVLLAPFFPELHRRCGLLDEKGVFRDFATAQRAVHLIQHAVTGGIHRAREHELILNKILCGIAPDTALVPTLQLTAAERAAVEELLKAVTQRWPRGAVLSPAGLRESYLRRPGQLTRLESHWLLRVERRGWDMLLGDLPWSFSVARAAWMPVPLHVDWI